MIEKMICPACSAPIMVSPGVQLVRCGFCSAEYAVVQEGDQVRLQLIDNPQPEMDELAQAAQAPATQVGNLAAGEPGAAVFESSPDVENKSDPENITAEPTVILSRPVEPLEFFEQSGAPAEPTMIRPSAADPVYDPPLSSPPVDYLPEPEIPAVQSVVYEQVGAAPAAKAPVGQRNKWLPWVIGGVVVFCLACLCIGAGIIFVLMPMFQSMGY